MNRKIHPRAIFLGFLADIVASGLIGVLIGILGINTSSLGGMIFALIAGLLTIVLGGYVTSRKSSSSKYFNSFLMGVFDLVFSLILIYFVTLPLSPTWFHIFTIVLTIPAAVLGAYIDKIKVIGA